MICSLGGGSKNGNMPTDSYDSGAQAYSADLEKGCVEGNGPRLPCQAPVPLSVDLLEFIVIIYV